MSSQSREIPEEAEWAFLVITTLGLLIRYEAANGMSARMPRDVLAANLAVAATLAELQAIACDPRHLAEAFTLMEREGVLEVFAEHAGAFSVRLTQVGRTKWLALRDAHEAERESGLRDDPPAFDPSKASRASSHQAYPGSTSAASDRASQTSAPRPTSADLAKLRIFKGLLYVLGVGAILGMTALWGALGFTISGFAVIYGFYRLHQELKGI